MQNNGQQPPLYFAADDLEYQVGDYVIFWALNSKLIFTYWGWIILRIHWNKPWHLNSELELFKWISTIQKLVWELFFRKYAALLTEYPLEFIGYDCIHCLPRIYWSDAHLGQAAFPAERLGMGAFRIALENIFNR